MVNFQRCNTGDLTCLCERLSVSELKEMLRCRGFAFVLSLMLSSCFGPVDRVPGMDRIDRLNVLHIIIDDLRPALGCYGDPVAKTPAIDRLSARGVQFDRAYVQYPICGPSRASFLSGLRPQTIDYFDWEYPPNVMLMPIWFRQNGYVTSAFGKVFHQGHCLYTPEEDIRMVNPPGAWDVWDLWNVWEVWYLRDVWAVWGNVGVQIWVLFGMNGICGMCGMCVCIL